MNLKEFPRREYAIEQYRQPLCYELAGEKFTFVMDSGYDYELELIDKEACVWSKTGAAPTESKYMCLKSDDTTYVLTYELKMDEKRACHTYIIDLEQQLVTLLISVRGMNPKFPYMVDSQFDFGYIYQEGVTPPYKRHCFTAELIDTTVEWNWGTDMVTRHAYLEPAYYRLTWPEDSNAAEEFAYIDELPSADEPARYIRIKNNMYLFVLTEKNTERYSKKSPFRSNNMVFLQNYDRMVHTGRAFGTTVMNGTEKDVLCMYSAFGNPTIIPDKFLNDPNPFTA